MIKDVKPLTQNLT